MKILKSYAKHLLYEIISNANKKNHIYTCIYRMIVCVLAYVPKILHMNFSFFVAASRYFNEWTTAFYRVRSVFHNAIKSCVNLCVFPRITHFNVGIVVKLQPKKRKQCAVIFLLYC